MIRKVKKRRKTDSKKFTLFPKRIRKKKPKQGPLSGKQLLKLSFLSAMLFIIAALVVQFIVTGTSAILLRHYSFSFHYKLFAVFYSFWGGVSWSEHRIYLVFLSGPILISFIGFLSYLLIKKVHYLPWRTKLFLTWFTFIALNYIPFSIISGSLFYDQLGIAFQWIVKIFIVRMLIALVILGLLLLTTRFWLRLFIKCAYSTEFLSDEDEQYYFLRHTFLIPWITGLVILMAFNLPFENWFWPVLVLTMGFPGFVFHDFDYRFKKVKIKKQEPVVFGNGFHAFILSGFIILCWVFNLFTINF